MNQKIIRHLQGFHIKSSEFTHNGETYVVGELRGQRFSIKYIDNEYRLYGGFSAVTMHNSTTHLSQVGGMVKRWAA